MAGVNSDDLHCFSLVADAGSISAAALALGCDASTLSRRMNQLEANLGTRLLHRSGRGVTLTAQGESLRDYARQVKQLLEQAAATLSRQGEQDPPRIRIAAQPTLAKVLFGDLFHAIRQRYPDTRIQFSEGLASSILPGLHAGEIDVAVLYRPPFTGTLDYEPLVSEDLHLLAPTDHAPLPPALSLAQVMAQPLILPSTHHGLRVTVDTAAARQGLAPRVALESDSSIALTLQLVHKGCGCTLLPLAAAQQDLLLGRLRAHAIEGHELQRCVALVAGKTALPSHALWAVNDLIRDVARQLVARSAWPGAAWIGQQVQPLAVMAPQAGRSLRPEESVPAV